MKTHTETNWKIENPNARPILIVDESGAVVCEVRPVMDWATFREIREKTLENAQLIASLGSQ